MLGWGGCWGEGVAAGCSHLWGGRRLGGECGTSSIHGILQGWGLMMLVVVVVVVVEGRAHRRKETDPFSCSPQPHLHSYKEAFEEMEGASPTSPPASGGEISPPTPAFPVSPQTPYSNPCKCCGSGRRRGLVGGSRQARNSPRVRQLRVPDTHRCINHSSSPSSSLLCIPPLHAAISIPLPSASHAQYPPVGFFHPSTH